ncbi:MAG: 50S ribosomal protein L4, partial [Candidatus Aenigmarchaeota archaeon]|nr:50S ribosomal protein L4 [Candidatus Aenigmarchaeota archaeon]
MATLYSIDGKKTGTVKLPKQFTEELRLDLIKRAVLAKQSHERQAYGADPRAGMKTAAENRGRRKAYGAWINRAMHRTVRIRVGQGSLTGRARIVPQAVKGRKAHPPKAEKNWAVKINDTERKLAIRSAIAATTNKEIVLKRGHKVEDVSELPMIIEDSFQKLTKTKEITEVLKKLGLEKELE